MLLSHRRIASRWGCVAFAVATLCICAAPVTAGTFSAGSRSELQRIERRVRAAHFLSRATFGPTSEEVDALAERMARLGAQASFAEWIDRQFSLPPSHHEPLTLRMIADDGFDPLSIFPRANQYKHYAWWHIALAAPDQLRQRMAWALSQIFVINGTGPGFASRAPDITGRPQYIGIVHYYDMLVHNALGNYRELLEDVTLHPIMGSFLSHVRNPKGDPSVGLFPDENYAREIMQLFSIGLYELHPNGVLKLDDQGLQVETYDNDTIKAFARVFTGLNSAGAPTFTNRGRNFYEPMQMFEEFHDTDEKALLRGTLLPAGQSGMEDIRDALDNIFAHPNVAPFIARLLIQRFVRSNPSKNYIRRVAAAFEDNGRGVRGDLRAVIRATLLDWEALKSQSYYRVREPYGLWVTTRGTEHSRLREPVLRYAAFLRAFHPTSGYETGRFMIPDLNVYLNQAAYIAPNVFNFYLPDHRPSGEILSYQPSQRIPNGTIFAPEFEIFTSVAANTVATRFYIDVADAEADYTVDSKLLLDFSVETELAADPAALLTHLDLLLCHGSLNDRTKQILSEIVATETDDLTFRARGAILAVLTSPECAVDQ